MLRNTTLTHLTGCIRLTTIPPLPFCSLRTDTRQTTSGTVVSALSTQSPSPNPRTSRARSMSTCTTTKTGTCRSTPPNQSTRRCPRSPRKPSCRVLLRQSAITRKRSTGRLCRWPRRRLRTCADSCPLHGKRWSGRRLEGTDWDRTFREERGGNTLIHQSRMAEYYILNSSLLV